MPNSITQPTSTATPDAPPASSPTASSAALPSWPARVGRAAVTTLALVALGLYVGSGHVACAFASIFHVPCPGCGSTRSVLALLRGDFHGVVAYNPLGPVMASLLGLLALQAVGETLAGRPLGGLGRVGFTKLTSRAVVVVGVLEVLLWGARFFGAFGGPVPV